MSKEKHNWEVMKRGHDCRAFILQSQWLGRDAQQAMRGRIKAWK